MDSHPQNPELRNNPENFHTCNCLLKHFHNYNSVSVTLKGNKFKISFTMFDKVQVNSC